MGRPVSVVSGLASVVRLPSSSPCPSSVVCRPPSASPGIALVMVLGILSVMVIMAVAFAISMRTERVAAGNYADSVRARQLVQVGLARALNDLAVNFGPTGLYQPDGKVYPNWTVTNSYNHAYTNTSTNANLLKLLALNRANEATNFVPRALWAAATNQDYSNPSNHWLPIDSLIYTNDAGSQYLVESNRMGRVKYLILNCSGLLDANFAGGTQGVSLLPRRMGTNPNEIAIFNLAEIGTLANAYSFVTNREHQVRYETLSELKELNATLYSSGSYPSDFSVYSYFPSDAWSNTVSVNLAGSVGNLTDAFRKSFIINAFTNAGFLPSEAGILFSNFIDYVDDDFIPSNWTTSVEAVPMINEIVVSNVVTDVGGGNSKMDTTIYFELWYPFVFDNAATFVLQYNATFSDLSGSGFVPPNVAWKNLASSIVAPGAQSFWVRSDGPLSLPSQLSPIVPVTFKSTIDTRVILLAGQEVDRVYSVVLTNVHAGVFPLSVASAGCFDPRFNGDPAQWSYQAAPTLGFINTTNSNYFAQNPDSAGETNMYVANRNLLRTVGELGYLAYAPWKTVKLYGPNLHRVLDVFAMGTNATVPTVTHSRCGLVNPNSRETNALAVAFADMPVDEYPGGPSNLLSMASALTIAGRLYNGGFYTNLSDIGRGLTNFSGLTDIGGTPISVSSELQKESFFRNTCGLLSVRQNLFTIIIEAQVASGGNIPRNPVKQRAVALVWRDPYTGEMFVRSIKWLKD